MKDKGKDGEMSRLLKGLLYKHEDPVIPRTHVKKLCTVVIPALRRYRQEDPWSHWPASLMVKPRPVRDPILKMQRVPKVGYLKLSSVEHACAHTHIHTCVRRAHT